MGQGTDMEADGTHGIPCVRAGFNIGPLGAVPLVETDGPDGYAVLVLGRILSDGTARLVGPREPCDCKPDSDGTLPHVAHGGIHGFGVFGALSAPRAVWVA